MLMITMYWRGGYLLRQPPNINFPTVHSLCLTVIAGLCEIDQLVNSESSADLYSREQYGCKEK